MTRTTGAYAPALLYAALIKRELGAPRMYAGPLVAVAAGIVAAWVATFVQSNGGVGMASILTRFDRTIASVVAIFCVLRAIDRIIADADSDWMLQHIAAGSSRMVYLATLILCVTIGGLVLSTSGAVAFGAATFLLAGSADSLVSAFTRIPLYALMILGASAFGGAVSVVVRGRSAIHIALVLIGAPWVGMWAAMILRDGNPLVGAIRLLNYPPPRLFNEYTVMHVSHAVLYIGVMLAIALWLADNRIGRRS